MMPAYLIARVEVNDWERYRHYLNATPSIIEKFGGRAIARSGEPITLEGPRETRRMVILQFPNVEKAREFYDSFEYQEARILREGAATGELVVVDGIVAGC
ncbi:MAG: DUF1330 domain-containing protein [Methanoregula sp.]|jgi:uncharacterized protein (DUF1330 family)|nr:DUF1330 domain-containing protein [Methanoregula sp.]